MYIQKDKKQTITINIYEAMLDILIIFDDSEQMETNLISPTK